MSARLVIDLDVFAQNLTAVRARVAPAEHMLVVKDDAYGHGLAPIVRRARQEGVSWFGAFDVRTALIVRSLVGPLARVFVWSITGVDEARAAVDAELDLGVGDLQVLEDVAEASRPGANARVHLKVDSGLRRNGIRPEQWDAAVSSVGRMVAEERVRLEGVWSHIAEASDEEDDRSRERFDAAVDAVRRSGMPVAFRHLAASAAGFARAEFRYDLARIGAFAYGIRSADGPSERELGVRPAATVFADVIAVNDDDVTIDLGSMHGLPSTASNRLSLGTPAGPRRLLEVRPGYSRVEAWGGAQVGDSLAVVGGDAPDSATDLAERLGTIGEEVALRLYPALSREYRGR